MNYKDIKYTNEMSGNILRDETIVPTNQFGIMSGKSTMKTNILYATVNREKTRHLVIVL